MRNVMLSDQLKEDRMALENLLANLPQNKPGKSSSLEMTPYNTPQLSPATTPANKKNRLPIGKESKRNSSMISDTLGISVPFSQSSLEVTLHLHLQFLLFLCRWGRIFFSTENQVTSLVSNASVVDDLHHSSLNWRKLLEWLVVIMVVVGSDNKGKV